MVDDIRQVNLAAASLEFQIPEPESTDLPEISPTWNSTKGRSKHIAHLPYRDHAGAGLRHYQYDADGGARTH